MTLNYILALLIGYLLGSIPFGLLLTRIAGKGDVREIGSGNIGATNVLRTGSKGLAAATLALDVAKGALAVWIARTFFPGSELFGAAGALIGHLYPVWLGFKGGKGVATFLGILLVLFFWAGVVYAIVWLVALLVIRISSVAGMMAAASAPIVAAAVGDVAIFPTLLAFALLVIWKHRENLARMRAGTEPRIGTRKG